MRLPARQTIVALAAAAVCALGTTSLDAPAASAAGPTGTAPFAGGSDAPQQAYPYVAGLRPASGGPRFFCTGTLVASRWVLTAAHCIDDKVNDRLEVSLGQNDLNVASAGSEVHQVDQKIVHPDWGGDAGDHNDVALVRLATESHKPPMRIGLPQQITDGIKRCQRQFGPSQPTNYLFLSQCPAAAGMGLGWGRVTEDGQTSTRLQVSNGPVYAMKKGGQFWRAKTGGCPGDSGGPLLVEGGGRDHRKYLIGVASHVDTTLSGGWCSRRGKDYYSDVATGSLNRWVKEKIG